MSFSTYFPPLKRSLSPSQQTFSYFQFYLNDILRQSLSIYTLYMGRLEGWNGVTRTPYNVQLDITSCGSFGPEHCCKGLSSSDTTIANPPLPSTLCGEKIINHSTCQEITCNELLLLGFIRFGFHPIKLL